MNARQPPPARRPTGRRRSAQYATLLKLCRARGCSSEDALDVVQEAHARLIEYLRSTTVRDPDSILRRIVVNITTNSYHHERTAPFASESIGELDRRGVLVDPAAGPERTLAAEQELDKVARFLRVEAPRACQMFIAQRVGYSHEEIAAAFALKPRTVEKHVATVTVMLSEVGQRG